MMFGNGFYSEGLRGAGNCLGFAGGYMHSGFFMFGFLLIAALAVLGTIFLVRKSHGSQSDKAVLEALKMRLVSGEITEEEYISKRNALK
jgi:uncharacterized membrane protein